MILLLGGSGYLGTALRRHMDRDGTLYVNVSRRDCNYHIREELNSLVDAVRPHFVINAAGFTGKPNVDACEIHKAECLRANAVLPSLIREVCERRKIAWGHVSSGCIYVGDGPHGQGFGETDPPNFTFRNGNCSFYSGCKALAEELLHGAENCYIWRLRIPFSRLDSPRNYLSKLMRYDRLLDARNSLVCVDEFVDACFQCYENRAEFGIYNLTNPGSVTTREVCSMLRKAGLCQKEFQYFESEEHFMREAAVAPRSNCVLDVSKARSAGVRLQSVVESLQQAIDEWVWAQGGEVASPNGCRAFAALPR